MNCYLHTERPATRALNIPCAPEGKLWVCDECYIGGPTNQACAEKFFAEHHGAVKTFAAQDARKRRMSNN